MNVIQGIKQNKTVFQFLKKNSYSQDGFLRLFFAIHLYQRSLSSTSLGGIQCQQSCWSSNTGVSTCRSP